MGESCTHHTHRQTVYMYIVMIYVWYIYIHIHKIYSLLFMILSPIVDREMPTTDRVYDIRTTEKEKKTRTHQASSLVAYASWIKGG